MVSYLHEYTKGAITAESNWILKVSSSREHTFTGLKSGIRIYARIAVIGRRVQKEDYLELKKIG